MRIEKKTAIILLILAACLVIAGAAVLFSKSRVIYVDGQKALDGIELCIIRPEDITDAEIDARIKETTLQYAELKQTDIIALGDVVSFDYSVIKDDLEQNNGYNHTAVVGKGFFSIDAENAMIGHKVGDRIELISVHNESEYAFEITVLSVKRYEYPVLTDEFVKEAFGSETVTEYRNSLRVQIAEEKNSAEREKAKSAVEEQIIDSSIVFLNKKDVKKVFNYYADYYTSLARALGMDVYSYAEMKFSMNREEFAKYLLEQSKKHVKLSLACKAIAEENEITVSETDISNYCEISGIVFLNGTPDNYHESRVLILLVTEFLLNNNQQGG